MRSFTLEHDHRSSLNVSFAFSFPTLVRPRRYPRGKKIKACKDEWIVVEKVLLTFWEYLIVRRRFRRRFVVVVIVARSLRTDAKFIPTSCASPTNVSEFYEWKFLGWGKKTNPYAWTIPTVRKTFNIYVYIRNLCIISNATDLSVEERNFGGG